MYISLDFIVTRFPDSLRAVRDHFLVLDPTDLTVDLLEKHLLAAETSVVAIDAACGTPRTPFFEGCSPYPLAPSYASAAAVDILGTEDVGAASALSGKHRSGNGKGGKGGGGGSGGGGGAGGGGRGGGGGGGSGGSGGGSGGFVGGGGGSGGSGGGGGGGNGSGVSGSVGGRGGAVQRGGSGGGQRQHQRRRSETPTPHQIREWFAQRGASGSSVRYPYVIRTEYGDEAECPHWLELLRSGVDIFALDYGAILAAMYALSFSAEGDCYLCVLPNPGIEAAALGASESSLLGIATAKALHTFTLDSGASCCFFRDSTTLTPLPARVPVRLADPSGGPVLARSSIVLPRPAFPCSSLSGLHLPLFSTNLVSTAALQDAMVTTTTPGGQRVSIFTCTRTGRHLATFTHRPWSSLYTLSAEPPQVAASGQVSVSGLCLPSRPRLPRPAFLASRGGSGRERYFLLVVDVYTRYTTVFPLRSKGEFPHDLPVLRLHSDRGGEFSSNLLGEFCRGEGILQSFTLPTSPQQNGIAEHRIGLVMEVARTSMIHAAAPHFLWPFGVRYVAHQLNLRPRVSVPETSPTLRWTGKVCDASVFRVWGSRAFVRDTSADKLSTRDIPCIFLGFSPDKLGWQFYHPTWRRVLLDPLLGNVHVEVTVDSSAARGATFGGAASGGAASGGAEHARAELGGAEPAGAEPGGAEPEGLEPRGAESKGAESRGAEPRGTGAGGTGATHLGGAGVTAGAGGTGGTGAVGPGGARTRGTGAAATGAVECAGAEDPGAGGIRAGGAGAGGTGAGVSVAGGTSAGGAGAGGAGVGYPGAGGAGAEGIGARDLGAGGDSGGGAGASGTGARGTVQRRPFFVPPPPSSLPPPDSVLRRVLSLPSSTGLTPPLLCPPPDQSQPQLQPDSPLPAPSPYAEQTDSPLERREPASRPASRVRAVRTGRHVPRPRPPPIPGTHVMALPRAASTTVPRLLAIVVTNPSFESTAASALVAELVEFSAAYRLDDATSLVAESESANPPSVRGECALGTDVLEDTQEDFECLAAAVPHLVAMLLAPEGDPDAPDIPTPRSYAEEITVPYSSQWQTAMDAEMAS
ncbi:unnamed protein product [Closterium sp. NIES-53]